MPNRPKSAERWREEDRGFETPCRIWQRATTTQGYGRVSIGGVLRLTHVVEYEAVHGPVPEGRQLDLLCRQPGCGRVDHLEAVTHRENGRRGLKGVLTTSCPRGHAYDASNTIRNRRGHRECRTCRNARKRKAAR